MRNRFAEIAVIGGLLVSAPTFFTRLYSYPWYRGSLLDWVAKLHLPKGARLLEVGCGPGNLSMALGAKGFQVTAVDRSQAMIRHAQKLPAQARFLTADALSLPFADNAFDAVIAGSLLNVVPEPQKLLLEMARVARPGGQISVLFPTPDFSVQASAQFADQYNLRGFEAAALSVWAAKARKLEPEQVETMFRNTGLVAISSQNYLGGMLACVTGQPAELLQENNA